MREKAHPSLFCMLHSGDGGRRIEHRVFPLAVSFRAALGGSGGGRRNRSARRCVEPLAEREAATGSGLGG